MKIRTRKDGDVCVLELTGKLAQPEGTEALRKIARELEDAGELRVVLDLRNVPWLDSSGLGEIVGCYTRTQDRGGDLRLVLPEKPLSGFTFTQLEQLFKIFESPEEAVASFTAGGNSLTAEGRYKTGWILGSIAYVFPLVVGTGWYLRLVPPMLMDQAEYRPFVHIGLANLMFTGFAGVLFCAYGLRRRIPAFWFLHLVFLLWVITNDLFAAVKGGWIPLPLVPGTLGTIALLLTAGCLKDGDRA